jgi:hypothetical protein
MKKVLGFPLSPQAMKAISGGVAMGCSATAECAEGLSVSCSGTVSCHAEDFDYVFCSTASASETFYCPTSPGGNS